jgi:hypothetical protein
MQPAGEPAEQAPREYAAEPAIISDYWTVGDQLGYASYADAIAEFIQHEDTRPPLTIGIKAPWGAGKISLMRMVQDRLDPPPKLLPSELPGQRRRRLQLTRVSRSFVAERSGRWGLVAPFRRLLSARGSPTRFGEGLGPVTNRMILRELEEQGQPHSDPERDQAARCPQARRHPRSCRRFPPKRPTLATTRAIGVPRCGSTPGCTRVASRSGLGWPMR